MATQEPTHKPHMILVVIEDWDFKPVREYKIDLNNPLHRRVFAEQSNNALRNFQIVTTMPEKGPNETLSAK